MNWFGWDPKSYGGAALGSLLGFFAFGALVHTGWSAPWIVGVLTGLGCAVVTSEWSSVRGAALGVGAAWVSAAADVHYLGVPGTDGLLAGLMRFHETLSPLHLMLHLASVLAAFVLGRASFRRGARQRLAGA